MRSSVDQSYPPRSIQLQIVAAKCLAAVALAVCSAIGAANSESMLHQRARQALDLLEKEEVYNLAYAIAVSPNLNTLDPARNTPQAQLREAMGLLLFAMTSCSSVSCEYLISSRAVSDLIRIAGDSGMLTSSSMIRGECAFRGLCYLESAFALMMHACKYHMEIDDQRTKTPLDLLIDALDSGVIGLSSRVLRAKVNLKNHDSAYSQIRLKATICRLIACCFILSSGEGNAGMARLYNAIDADCAASTSSDVIDSRTSQMASTAGRSDLVASTVSLLRATIPFAQKILSDNSDEPLPMVDLSEACLLAVGGMCGAKSGYNMSDLTRTDSAVQSVSSRMPNVPYIC
jgi:hypothetical protein